MKTLIATALTVLSLAASSTAGVATTSYESPAIRGEAVKSRTIERPAPEVVLVPVSDGFEWGDAAVGAAAAMGLVLVAAASLGLRRVRRRPA